MRKVTMIGTLIATMLVFGMMLVPIAGANSVDAPVLQATSTAEATAAATTAPAATAAATVAATATRAPSTLPNTGGDSGMGSILLGVAALLIIGIAAATLMAGRRGVQQ